MTLTFTRKYPDIWEIAHLKRTTAFKRSDNVHLLHQLDDLFVGAFFSAFSIYLKHFCLTPELCSSSLLTHQRQLGSLRKVGRLAAKTQNLHTVHEYLTLPNVCVWRYGVNEGQIFCSKVEQDEEVMVLPELRVTWTNPGQRMGVAVYLLTHVELYETLENPGRTGPPLRLN